ncbi:MAG: nucleotidyltransferase family protein [Methylobacteriaceae bacterium]|nr:nucleotidyltransferase family protein [Methylobacteriaceae bacterium]
MAEVAAIVLAAGAASRYRAADPSVISKLLVEFDGMAIVRRVVEAALASRARPAIVVTGHARTAIEAALDGLGVQFAFNADHAAGLAASLKAGVALVPNHASGAVVLLGDMPLVTPDLVDLLIDAFDAAPQASAVVPVFGGVRGNPVLLSRRLFPAVVQLSGDYGARKLIAGHADVIELEVAQDMVSLDIDTPEALREFQSRPEPAA